MPQLDMFIFFGVFSSFFFFFAGMFVFCSYVVPFFMYMGKLGSNRIYYYYISLLHMRRNRSEYLFCQYMFHTTNSLFFFTKLSSFKTAGYMLFNSYI